MSAALTKLYERHAKDCALAAGRTDEPKRREEASQLSVRVGAGGGCAASIGKIAGRYRLTLGDTSRDAGEFHQGMVNFAQLNECGCRNPSEVAGGNADAVTS